MENKLREKLIAPHTVISRPVQETDLKRVKEDAEILFELCHTNFGSYNGGFAVAHSQITKDEPLRFFVLRSGEVIINPVIINHTKVTVERTEGCLSFLYLPGAKAQRWNKCTVRFQILREGNISKEIEKNISGIDSQVFQHEIDHFEGKYIHV